MPFFERYCALTTSPPQQGCQRGAMCSAPQKADAHRQICHPVPPLSPAERLLSWVGLISWSKPDILENVCSGAEQAGIFISHLHLHCFLSWRGAGGGGRMRCGFLVPAQEAPKRTLLSSFRGLSSSSSPGLREAGASRTFQRSAQLEDIVSNYPPIPLACKMCFYGSWVFGKVSGLWVASCCSFRRPKGRASRYPDPSNILPLIIQILCSALSRGQQESWSWNPLIHTASLHRALIGWVGGGVTAMFQKILSALLEFAFIDGARQ